VPAASNLPIASACSQEGCVSYAASSGPSGQSTAFVPAILILAYREYRARPLPFVTKSLACRLWTQPLDRQARAEDRVMTEKAVLDYDDFAVAMWRDGMNIKRPNSLRRIV
jgi:hypothetical protein